MSKGPLLFCIFPGILNSKAFLHPLLITRTLIVLFTNIPSSKKASTTKSLKCLFAGINSENSRILIKHILREFLIFSSFISLLLQGMRAVRLEYLTKKQIKVDVRKTRPLLSQRSLTHNDSNYQIAFLKFYLNDFHRR